MSENIYRQFDETHDVYMSDEYMLHTDRMTREGLHSKSEIALELSIRDQEIKSFIRQLQEATQLHDITKAFHDEAIAERNLAHHQLQEAEANKKAMSNRMEWTVTDNAKKAIVIADLQKRVEELEAEKGP